MNKLLYLSDDDVQSQLAAKYDLLVNVGLETFQYAIIDNARAEVKVLAEFEIPNGSNSQDLIKAIEDLPEGSRQFKYSYNSVKLSFYTSQYTFIPSDLYLESNQQDYGKFLGLNSNSEILNSSIRSSQIEVVLAIDTEFSSDLKRIFNKPKIYNQAGPFLEGTIKCLKREDDLVCFIDVQSGNFQVALFKDFSLEFHNCFEYANADEFNYYLLNLIQSLEMEVKKLPVVLSGKVFKTDEIYLRIGKYFENICFNDSENLTKYSEKLEGVLPHTFLTLFSLNLCE